MQAPAVQTYLGIDPGLQRTGFGLIRSQGQTLEYILSGTIQTTHLDREDLPARLGVIVQGIQELVEQYRPHASAVEIVFVNTNPKTSLLLGQARGACIAALVSGSVPVHEYTALQLKKAIAGHGRAHKAEIQEMVKRLLKLPGLPGPDAADALGLAITHARMAQVIDRMAQSKMRYRDSRIR
ncbi:MAG: crossover junction endodeoxyribonuclease RuvC [Pseudomonadota bacterium]|jgi:crossover junction endodeoxyribonuclease RuvC